MPTPKTDNKWFSPVLLAATYGFALFFIQFFLQKAGLASNVPEQASLMRYDANVYESIMQKGYEYPDERCNNTGCYILFPMFWRLLHLGAVGIGLVNIVLFAIGFGIVCRLYKTNTTEKILWLATPSLYFMAVPYTEALFCVLCALSFYGIAANNRWLIWISLFLMSLTRATAIFLLPSLFIMELLANHKRSLLRVIRTYIVEFAFPVVLGLAVFVVIQYVQVGIWFAYFKQQIKYLGHEWAMPTLPFSNFFGEQRITWLSGLAMLVCVVALMLLAGHIYRWVRKDEVVGDRVLTLTLTYLPVTLLCIIFCNPTWGSNTTNLLGLHRYTLGTPFIFVFLHYVAGGKRIYLPGHFIVMFFVCNIVWLSMGSYVHLQYWLFWNFVTLIVFAYMLFNNAPLQKRYEWIPLVLIAFNILVQVHLFQQYLSNQFTD